MNSDLVSNSIFPAFLRISADLRNLVQTADFDMEDLSINTNYSAHHIEFISSNVALLGILALLWGAVTIKTTNGPATYQISKVSFRARATGEQIARLANNATVTTLGGWMKAPPQLKIVLKDQLFDKAHEGVKARLLALNFILDKFEPKKGNYGMASNEVVFTMYPGPQFANDPLFHFNYRLLRTIEFQGGALNTTFNSASLAKIKFACKFCMIFNRDQCKCDDSGAKGRINNKGNPNKNHGYKNVDPALRNSREGHMSALFANVGPVPGALPEPPSGSGSNDQQMRE